MLAIQIGLVSTARSISSEEIRKVAAALDLQVNRDLAPIWGTKASVVPLSAPDYIEPGIWPIFVVPELPPGMGGLHKTDHHQPYALVEAGPTWSLSASHECLEMLVDPNGNRLVAATALQIIDDQARDKVGEKFEYLLEICDPSEDPSSAYLINDVLVADFYTPHFFDPIAAEGVRYSYTGKITRPRQVLPNGYVSWINPGTGALQQLRAFGAPEIVTLQRAAAGAPFSSLRAEIDRQTHAPTRLSHVGAQERLVVHRHERSTWLEAASMERASRYVGVHRTLTPAPAPPRPASSSDLAGVIQRNLDDLRGSGAYSVRPGFRFAGGWITDEAAIVVKAAAADLAQVKQRLPARLGGIPVEVRPMAPSEQLRQTQPVTFAAIMTGARHEYRSADFAHEVVLQARDEVARAPLAHPAKTKIPYSGPPASLATLDPVEEEMTLILHASPERGWENLRAFLGNVQSELIVGMYDLTSAHVLAALKTGLADNQQLTMTLDHPARNPGADQTDEEARQALEAALSHRYRGAWALTGTDPLAPVWIYPNAYHIKVAVKDRKSFWLSSGNWNNSNQPVIDLNDRTAALAIARRSDRDWHAVVTSETLAKTFREFLLHDYTNASEEESFGGGGHAEAALRSIFGPSAAAEVIPEVLQANAPARGPIKFFETRTITGRIRIQPLLTPDNYQPHILALIQSARSKLYMQTQYIHPSTRPEDAAHTALLDALAERIRAGVDVRLITSEFETSDWVEKVKAAGIDPAVLRIQPKVHNKGIVVDSSAVVISSQNWSADGTLRNRDAGLIIYHQEAAAYFEEIFLHDWENMASQRVTS